MTKEQFAAGLESLGTTVNEHQLEQLETYLKLLQEWNEKMNLTAITQEELVWEKHFYDSIVPFLNTDFETLCDVGSGAGFPGIPLAILYPDRQFTLVEPLGKRCRFLEEVVRQLGLKNVTVENARAEDYARDHRESFDAVSARAVARLSILMELCLPLLKENGEMIALKGSGGLEEVKQAEPAFEALNARLDHSETFSLPDEGDRINLYIRKNGPTDKKYPRAYGLIKKKPLEK